MDGANPAMMAENGGFQSGLRSMETTHRPLVSRLFSRGSWQPFVPTTNAICE